MMLQKKMKIMRLQNVPETLNVYELMEVKGGGPLDSVGANICIFTAAVKCKGEGSGIIIQQPKPSE